MGRKSKRIPGLEDHWFNSGKKSIRKAHTKKPRKANTLMRMKVKRKSKSKRKGKRRGKRKSKRKSKRESGGERKGFFTRTKKVLPTTSKQMFKRAQRKAVSVALRKAGIKKPSTPPGRY